MTFLSNNVESLSVFIIGLIAGSFLNVVIYRLNKRAAKNIIFGRSFCPNCRAQLKWHDLVPMLSFIWLLGRCRYCQKKISLQYPVVEILSGLIWLGIFYKVFGFDFQFPLNPLLIKEGIGVVFNMQFLNFLYYIFIPSTLLVIAVYDFKWQIIPNKIVYLAIAVAILYNSFLVLKFGNWRNHFLNPLLIAIILFAFCFFIFYLSKGRAMGLGDAKLVFLIGLFLSPLLAIVAFTLAFIIGAIFGIILIGLSKIFYPLFYKKWGIKSQIAFGPFLVLGTAIAFFFPNFLNFFQSFFVIMF